MAKLYILILLSVFLGFVMEKAIVTAQRRLLILLKERSEVYESICYYSHSE